VNAKTKAGIFDPWRQKPPAPKKAPEPVVSEDGDVAERVIRYESARAGISIRVPDTENAMPDALSRLRELFRELHELKRPALTKLLEEAHVGKDGRLNDSFPAGPAALCLRKAILTTPEVAVLLARYRVKAYLR